MKTKYFLPAALLALALGACSDNTEIITPLSGQPSWTPDGYGYMTLSINLPTQRLSAPRAQNDDFNDGLPGEYEVKDATLILFTNAAANAEADATFHSAYKLNLLDSDFHGHGTDTDPITTEAKLTQKIKRIEGNAFALVILNNNGLFTVDNEGALTFANEDKAVEKTVKWSDFRTKMYTNESGTEKAVSAFTKNGFLMANAVLADKPGSTTKPEGAGIATLADVNEANIENKEAESFNAPAATIYVERAVAKVTVTATQGTTTEGSMSYNIAGWLLDNTNKSSYYTAYAQSTDSWWQYAVAEATSSQYRFIGDTKLETDTTLYRTYWAKDPNYDSYAGVDSHPFETVSGTPDASFIPATNDKYAYCLENTFNVANQTIQQTTRVIIKAIFNEGKPFYMKEGDKLNIYPEDKWNPLFAGIITANPEIYKYVQAAYKQGQSIEAGDFESFMTEIKSETGTVVVTEVSFSDAGKEKFNNYAEWKVDETAGEKVLIEAINENSHILGYAGGAAYYPVRIKHFGDDLTPWKDLGEDDAYPGKDETEKENNYLGRYGVLRNNWYQINVSSIAQIGSPVVPSVPGVSDPDDEISYYIICEINILPWAVRKQDVEL